MLRQFANVSSKYGAPMGRRSWPVAAAERVRLFRVRLVDGYYDDGGAYWGAPANLWCARWTEDGEMREAFERAPSRVAARDAFGLTDAQLLRRAT